MHKSKLTTLILLALLIASCVPESKKVLTEVDVNFELKALQDIINHQAAQNSDSLLPYLSSASPTERYLATRAFASFQDPQIVDSLKSLLEDPVVKVRAMAAYSIGQIGQTSSQDLLTESFRQKDTMSVDNASNAEIIEALGKLAGAPIAEFIATADGYRESDTLLTQAQMKSLYRFGLRDIKSKTLIEKATNTVRNQQLSKKTRLFAAHYLSRTADLNIENVKFQIAEAFVDETDANIKMALALALKHTEDKEIGDILIQQLNLAQDYRVTCNILRALQSYEYLPAIEKVLELVRSKNLHVARTAVQYLSKKGLPEAASIYRNIARDSIPWQVKADLHGAIFEILPYYYTKTKNATRWQVQQLLDDESDPYELCAYLKVFGKDPESYPYLIEQIQEHEDVRVRTVAMASLNEILSHKDFEYIFKNYSRSVRRNVLDLVVETLANSNDEGLIAASADIIANKESGLKELIDSTNFLLAARDRLSPASQLESINAVERALAHMRGVNKPNLTKATELKATDWSMLSNLGSSKNAIVKTTKGNFTIDLNVTAAPMSVLNFVSLSNKDFYDSLVFHRVVPNFVIQTGSPRGDSYGGADYVISSELSPLSYDDQGYVGMASAGLHTESAQWFVTHSPTPHLDGKYTIFGKVVEGMEVVHAIQEGDQIIDIIISNL